MPSVEAASVREELHPPQPDLCVTFWNIALGNFPEGGFRHRQLSAEAAAARINRAKATGRALFVSQDDLAAPYEKRRLRQIKELADVLRSEFAIDICINDFFAELERDMKTILPLDVIAIRPDRSLMVVTCSYIHNKAFDEDGPGFSVAPDTVNFHLFEVVESGE